MSVTHGCGRTGLSWCTCTCTWRCKPKYTYRIVGLGLVMEDRPTELSYHIAGNFRMVLIFVYFVWAFCMRKLEILHEPWPHNSRSERLASLVFTKSLSGLPRDLSASVLRSQHKVKRLTNLAIEHHVVLQAISTVGKLHRRGLATLAYEIKTYENLFCGVFGQIHENLDQRKFPAIWYSCTCIYSKFRHPCNSQVQLPVAYWVNDTCSFSLSCFSIAKVLESAVHIRLLRTSFDFHCLLSFVKLKWIVAEEIPWHMNLCDIHVHKAACTLSEAYTCTFVNGKQFWFNVNTVDTTPMYETLLNVTIIQYTYTCTYRIDIMFTCHCTYNVHCSSSLVRIYNVCTCTCTCTNTVYFLITAPKII